MVDATAPPRCPPRRRRQGRRRCIGPFSRWRYAGESGGVHRDPYGDTEHIPRRPSPLVPHIESTSVWAWHSGSRRRRSTRARSRVYDATGAVCAGVRLATSSRRWRRTRRLPLHVRARTRKSPDESRSRAHTRRPRRERTDSSERGYAGLGVAPRHQLVVHSSRRDRREERQGPVDLSAPRATGTTQPRTRRKASGRLSRTSRSGEQALRRRPIITKSEKSC